MTWDLVTHESELTKYLGCGRPKLYRTRWGTRRRPTLRLLLQHSTLSPYSLNTNLCRALPLSSNHFCSSMRCQPIYIGLLDWWLQEGVLAGVWEVPWSERRCIWPSNFHRLLSCIRDLFPEAVWRRLWVHWLCEGGAAGPLGAAGLGPPCHPLQIML
jgi:hypothetical protein